MQADMRIIVAGLLSVTFAVPGLVVGALRRCGWLACAAVSNEMGPLSLVAQGVRLQAAWGVSGGVGKIL